MHVLVSYGFFTLMIAFGEFGPTRAFSPVSPCATPKLGDLRLSVASQDLARADSTKEGSPESTGQTNVDGTDFS